MTHKINIPNSSALLLVSVLASPGWAKTIEDIIVGGSLLVEVFGKFEPKKTDDDKLDPAWLDETSDWELTEKQRDGCKRAITLTIAEKKMPVAKTSYLLVKAFGLE